MTNHIKRGEAAVLTATLAYIAAFTVWFMSRGNYEFIFYVATMLGLIALVGVFARRAAFPLPMLWALSLWGLLHMAGGGVPAGGSVLYNLVVLPLGGSGEMVFLKYDQLVHAYGFGVTAWLLWHLLVRNHPSTRGTATSFILPALGAMGLGAVNEIIEFASTLMVPETNVGGYVNTALDLVMNAVGAVVAMALVALTDRRRRA